jgi:CheY-like chemotaxis protein
MKILVVEDSEEVSCITVEYLQELGHEAVAVVDAEQALLQLAAVLFDAVMTDVRLPGMSGIDLARRLATTLPMMPVIIVSGYGSLAAELRGDPALARVLTLGKPYDLDQLAKTLSAAEAATGRS